MIVHSDWSDSGYLWKIEIPAGIIVAHSSDQYGHQSDHGRDIVVEVFAGKKHDCYEYSKTKIEKHPRLYWRLMKPSCRKNPDQIDPQQYQDGKIIIQPMRWRESARHNEKSEASHKNAKLSVIKKTEYGC
jgi:hypothetical protein